jgi:phytoene dehydrogenase-like protein
MAEAAAQQRIQRGYDCVVVGAGNGGLAAAAQLATAGAQVLLLEQHTVPGGFATSFVRGRFEFEAALHQLADVGPPTLKGEVRRFLEDDLGVYLDWVEVPEAYRLIVTDPGEHLDVTMPYGVQAYVDAFEKEVPGSRELVTRYLDLCQEVIDAIIYLGESRGNPDRKVLTTKYANFLRTAPYTVDEVADALQIPERVRKILHCQWAYIGLPTSRASFIHFAAMMAKFHRASAWIPRHRSHELAQALDAKIRERGGNIQYNTRVKEIQVRDGRVVGVVTARGDRIATDRVVANVSPTVTYNSLIHPKSEVPEIALRSCNARLPATSCFVVYMGLDVPLEELGLHEYSYFIYSNTNSEDIYDSAKVLQAPKGQAALCLNNAIPDCSPPGTSIISLTTLLLRPEPWKSVGPRNYVQVKNRIASDLLADFEKATGTSLREHIEEFEVATPQTFARYTGAHNGIIYGYESEPWDSPIVRMMMMEEDSYFDGLQLCGGYGIRGLGYHASIMTGQLAALLTLRDMDRAGEHSGRGG